MKHAKDFSSPDALKEYLRDHPQADPKKHHVVKPDGGRGSGSARVKHKLDKGIADEIKEVWKNKPSGNAVSVVQQMIDDGKEISVNLINRAVVVLKNEMSNAEGDQKKKLKGLHDKLKGQMHKEGNSKIALNVTGRFVAGRL